MAVDFLHVDTVLLRRLPIFERHKIAAELSVSVNTVSTHLRSIYAKLGAYDRSAAVRRARELRLLATVRSEHYVRRARTR